jgi:hypothetical protein
MVGRVGPAKIKLTIASPGGLPPNLTAEPLTVSLLHFQTHSKGPFRQHRMFLIKNSKEPLAKGLEAHSTTFSM